MDGKRLTDPVATRLRGHTVMMDPRFRDGTPYWAFRDEYLVVCPKCADRATVKTVEERGPRLVCDACGHVQEWNGTLRVPTRGSGFRTVRPSRGTVGGWVDHATGRRAHVDTIAGSDVDPYFSAPLWLRGEVRGHVLWANNEAHLDYLASFVGAQLREGFAGVNKTVSAHLPEWMKTSKNRNAVMRELARMRATLDRSAG